MVEPWSPKPDDGSCLGGSYKISPNMDEQEEVKGEVS